MIKLKKFDEICTLLQIIVFILMVISRFLPDYIWVVIGITSFAGFVRMFLPLKGNQDTMICLGSLVSLAIIIFSVMEVTSQI